MISYLKIENPGVAPEEAFTLLGASTKRNNGSSATIGKFGTGNKHGVAVLLRNNIVPIVFASNLKMEFGTRPQGVNDGMKNHNFNRVFVKFGGKDVRGASRSSTEDLGFVLEHGATDWHGIELAMREFVSNALDRAIEEGEFKFIETFLADKSEEFIQQAKNSWTTECQDVKTALGNYRKNATDYNDVTIEIVSQVRAKAGSTRVFIPLTEDVFKFYNNIGKWFLHFSEPQHLNSTILPKKNRNLGEKQSAVIYRRGVRVREITWTDTPSLYDYNLENLTLDESRNVDDWKCQVEAAHALASADVETIARLWQSFIDGRNVWEHSFSSYGLENGIQSEENRENWRKAFDLVAGDDAVISTAEGSEVATRKGYKVIIAPEAFVQAAEKRGIKTPSVVLSADEQEGREIYDATTDANSAVDFAWNLCVTHGMTNGKSRPQVKTFRKIMSAGSQCLGFYNKNIVYINQDIAGNTGLDWHELSQQLLATALEEVIHHVTGAADFSRDLQDCMLNLLVHVAKS